MERTRETPRSQSGEQVDERRPAAPDLAKFQKLIADSKNGTENERRDAAATIIDMLIAMRAPGNDRQESTAILKELELRTLGDLTDDRGRNCRKEAVETLMVMGFPYALSVSPDDFEFARRYVAEALPRFGERAKDIRLRTRVIATLGLAGEGLLLVGAALTTTDRWLNLLAAVLYPGLPLIIALAGLAGGVKTQKSALSVGGAMCGAAALSLIAALAIGPVGWIGTVMLSVAGAIGYRLQDHFENWDEFSD